MSRPKPNFTVTPGTPSRAAVENVANWVDMSDQVESDVRPQRRQDRIDDETHFSAADVWLAGDQPTLGLLKLLSGRVIALDVFDGDVVWRAHRNTTGKWWIDRHRNAVGVTLADATRFPLRYRSRLAYEDGLLIKGIINRDGTSGEWTIEEG